MVHQIDTIVNLSSSFAGSIAWLSITFAPGVVVFHGEAGGRRTIFVHERFVEDENQCVPWIQGKIQFAAQAEVLLRIVLINPVEEGSAAK